MLLPEIEEWEVAFQSRVGRLKWLEPSTEDAIRDESFASVNVVTAAITEYLAERNLVPKRYVWKAEGAEILKKIQRARAALAAQSV